MKKPSFLLIAGALLAFASCQNNATDTGDNQAQIDSAVNARVEELRMQMMMQNDSIINAEAQRRADSIVAEMKGGTTSSTPRKTTGKSTSENKPADQPTKSNTPTNVNDRPGGNATDRTPKNVNDRPGGNATDRTPKNVNDRPGGNK